MLDLSAAFDCVDHDNNNNNNSEITLPLTHLFNKSLQNSKFPDKLKIERIVPIYKCDNKKIINNYRPISVLPYFSKF